MRPRNLRIEGFTCFRQPVEIDFTGMDVFVIAGPTGAGKTTLVDAICYALYGKVPRGTTIRDLIARDAAALRVQLEFESGGRAFRVHRGVNVNRTTNKKTGKETASRDISPVQFEELVAGEWTPVSDRVGEMNAVIEKIVGLDFESFTKCVLLPQGRFAEFLTGKPDERRRILIDLLDIGIYTRIMQAANTRASKLATQIAERETQLRQDYANATEEALIATREQLTAAAPLLESERARRDALQSATQHASTVVAARRREHEYGEGLKRKDAELASAESLAKDGAATLAELADALKAAEAELAASPYDAALHSALGRAESCARQAERARTVAEAARSKAADRSGVESAEKAAADADSTHAAAREALVAAEEALREAERHDAATYLQRNLKPGDACPVCGGKVGAVSKPAKSRITEAERTVKKARADEAAAAQAASKASAAVAAARQALDSASKAAEEDAAAELARAEKELAEALPDGMPSGADELAALLADQDRARGSHETLAAAVEQGRRALQEHQQSIAESQQRIVALRAEMKQIEASIASERAEREAAIVPLKDIATAWQWRDVIELIEQKKSPLDLLNDMLTHSQKDVEELTSRIAGLEHDVAAIERAIARAGELRTELESMKERHQLCKDLGVLLRQDNFQQFVIGEAMQVLADTASEHLRTLFDRFSITVDDKEFAVVDHWQADQVRPAKTLSGGETFVASLALALALAQRLPELRSAAAASLESLFLDEGFGTLDVETLDTVIEALEGLRSQERMVGVITHVPELTQRIEHRIIVRKSPAGSSVEIEGGAPAAVPA